MILVIDIGNTHTVFGIVKDDKIVVHWRVTSALARTEDEIGILLKNYFDHEGYLFSAIDGVSISSVVPDLTNAYVWMSQKYLKKDALVVDSSLELGLVTPSAG